MPDLETIKIQELTEASSAENADQLIMRQGLIDKRITVGNFKDSITNGATLSTPGIVQLYNGVDSNSTSFAGTSNSVRLAYNRGTEALNQANNAMNVANGKANASHNHSASNITSGVLSWERCPLGQFGAHGVVRIDDSDGTNGSYAPFGQKGYVPSVERVNSLKQQIDQLNATISSLELGSAFMPLPYNGSSANLQTYPIGSYIVADAGKGFYGTRNQTANFGIRLAPSKANQPGNSGRFEIFSALDLPNIPSSQVLTGTWAQRGAIGTEPDWTGMPSNERTGLIGQTRTFILCQRIA